MKVELILRTKGSDVFSVMETETVAEAVELLRVRLRTIHERCV